jgi:hypothetical protein
MCHQRLVRIQLPYESRRSTIRLCGSPGYTMSIEEDSLQSNGESMVVGLGIPRFSLRNHGYVANITFCRRTTEITRLPPRDLDLRKRPIGNSGAFFCYPTLIRRRCPDERDRSRVRPRDCPKKRPPPFKSSIKVAGALIGP